MKIVTNLFTGRPTLIPNSLTISAINRNPVEKITVNLGAIHGDQVANLIHHGGRNRVLHQYPLEHYQYLKQQHPHLAFSAGSMGENLSAMGYTEADVCIGDIFQIGSVQCVVTEPRKPCATINLKFGVKGLARKVQEVCKVGWFYRILSAGEIAIGDKIELIDRPFANLTLENCIHSLLNTPNKTTLELMISNPILSDNWKKPAKELLKTGIKPDDRNRLGD